MLQQLQWSGSWPLTPIPSQGTSPGCCSPCDGREELCLVGANTCGWGSAPVMAGRQEKMLAAQPRN